MSVIMPQKQRGAAGSLGTIGTVVGGVVGGVYGGPGGAVAGAQAGNQVGTGIGQIFGNKATPQAVGGGGVGTAQKSQSDPIGGALNIAGGTSAMQRRMGDSPPELQGKVSDIPQGSAPMQRRMDQSNPSEDLQQAEMALASLPPEQQKTYGPTIMQARRMDQMSRGYS